MLSKVKLPRYEQPETASVLVTMATAEGLGWVVEHERNDVAERRSTESRSRESCTGEVHVAMSAASGALGMPERYEEVTATMVWRYGTDA